MNSPTKNESRPNAVRFRWKLSVRRSRSVSASGSTRRSRSPAIDSSAARGPLRLADKQARDLIGHFQQPLSDADIDHHHARRELLLPREAAARRSSLLISGEAPSFKPSSASVSGAALVSPGGMTKACKSPPMAGVSPTSAGRVTGSMPSTRNALPLIWIRPSRTGDTGQPARRRSTNSCCEKVRSVAGHQRRGSDAAERCGRAIVAVPRLQVQRLHAAP